MNKRQLRKTLRRVINEAMKLGWGSGSVQADYSDHLLEGTIIAMQQGLSEAEARALGQRSIEAGIQEYNRLNR